VLADSPVVRSAGPRILFLVGAILTAAILLWTHQMRLSGELHGLTTIFFVLFAYNDYSGAVCALLILAGAVFVSGYMPARGILRWAGERPVTIAVISAALLAAGTLVVYHNHPLSMDEYAADFQSRVLAAGHLSGKLPPALLDWLIPPGFQNYFLNVSPTSGRVSESYWPGFALLLTPFTWAGVPWLCNPVISALTLLVIHRLAMEMFDDREAAGLALLLTIASPVIFANGISYYSMPAHLLCNSAFALLLLRPNPLRCVAAGMVGSLALVLHNPVPHMLFAVPWLIWVATRPGGLGLLAALCAGYLPFGALLGLGWFIFSDHLLHESLATVASPTTASDRLQSMLSVLSLPRPTLLLARLIGVAKIWVWAVPGLLVLAGAGATRWHRDAKCRLFTASAVLTFLGYFLVPVDQGHGWGYRYFHSAWMALPLLATAALYRPTGTSSAQEISDTRPFRIFEDPGTKAYVTACILLTLIFGVGWRAWQMQSFLADDLSQLPHYAGQEHRVVIIDDSNSFYGGDLVQNDPWLRGDVIRMYSHGAAADAQMMRQQYPLLHMVYADRHGAVWSTAPSVMRPPKWRRHDNTSAPQVGHGG
jgi:hypothetical protein